MKRKILRCLWLIPFIGGIFLGIAGIAKINQANKMYVPEMGEEGWFDASSEQSDIKMAGFAMAAGGFLFLPVIALAVGVGIKHATTTPEEEAEETAKEINKNKRFKQKLKELAGEEAAEKYNYDDADAEEDVDADEDEDFDFDNLESPYPRVKRLQNASKTSSNEKSKTKYCEFCGSANTSGATKCSSCGASFTSKRK